MIEILTILVIVMALTSSTISIKCGLRFLNKEKEYKLRSWKDDDFAVPKSFREHRLEAEAYKRGLSTKKGKIRMMYDHPEVLLQDGDVSELSKWKQPIAKALLKRSSYLVAFIKVLKEI